jgi:phosphatidylinositol-3-phosphatase
VEENHPLPSIIGRSDARYFTSLARSGASMTGMYAITHPSEPNYLALFSGSTKGLTDDSCPHTYRGTNLGNQLRRAKRSFVGYAEGLPRAGYTGCTAGGYARKHVPWADFADLPAGVNQPLTAFPGNFANLPAVSFVIPDLDHDMHDGTIAQADHWLRQHLDAYRRWAMTHHSLLVVTWDEDDHSDKNRIPTIIAGQDVHAGSYREHADLYRLLRTLEWLYRLPGVGHSAQRAPISDIWAR